jgi:antitoxin component of RelBE/YafQ-DinJ toxin-antitoxin module
MLYNFKGFFDKPAQCKIDIFKKENGNIIVLATEIKGNSGTSVTNACELLMKQVIEEFEIPMEKLIWIEKYYDEEHYDIVHTTYNYYTHAFEKTSWKRLKDINNILDINELSVVSMINKTK